MKAMTCTFCDKLKKKLENKYKIRALNREENKPYSNCSE